MEATRKELAQTMYATGANDSPVITDENLGDALLQLQQAKALLEEVARHVDGSAYSDVMRASESLVTLAFDLFTVMHACRNDQLAQAEHRGDARAAQFWRQKTRRAVL